MRRPYASPPLIEALCEFHFEAGQPWDWTIPGLIYAEVRAEFPDKAEHKMIQMNAAPERVTTPSLTTTSRIQFFRQDRSALIQVGPNALVVNHLRPYPTWEPFRDLIFRQLRTYAKIAQPKSVQRINLRYINKIEIPLIDPTSSFNIGEYMLAVPGVPKTLLKEPVSQFIQRVEIPNPNAQGTLVMQSGTAPTEREDIGSFLLDLDFTTNTEGSLSFDGAQEWIVRAHEEIEIAFEACITDAARKLFGEKKDG